MIRNFPRGAVWAVLGALAALALFAFQPAAHALPEYATRTGEPCATCHVNPAGGGPRTERGNLWIAAGRPDQVPPLPAGTAADASSAKTTPAGSANDGAALYTGLGCSGCHGAAGTGGAGPALNRGEIPADQLSQILRQGKGTMPALPAGVPDAELAALVRYVTSLGGGQAAPQATGASRPSPPRLVCTSQTLTGCRGN